MKIGGKEVKSSWEPDPIVFSRGRDENGAPILLAFKARGIRNYDEFDELCPMPSPKTGYLTKDGWQTDDKSPRYRDELKQWREKRFAYYVIKSLEPSGIEWDRVRLTTPETWKYYDEELRGVLNEIELAKVHNLIDEANSLNAAKLEENRQTFFQQQEESGTTLGPPSEAASTHSSAPVSVAG